MQFVFVSLIKIMIVYVIGKEIQVGNISFDDEVKILENVWVKNFFDFFKMFIEVGIIVKVCDLLCGIIV